MADANVPAWTCPRGHLQLTNGVDNAPSACPQCASTDITHLGNVRVTNVRNQG